MSKINKLTEEDKQYIKRIYQDKNISWEERMSTLTTKFNISERQLRRWCSNTFKLKQKKDIENPTLKAAKSKKHNKAKKRFLITSAQNCTKINSEFFSNLEAYAKHIDAELLVIPYRYKNPTSKWTTNNEDDEWWDARVLPYLTLNRHALNSNISILADIKIQPTAANPLQGLEGMTGTHSCVVGHPRIELKSVAVVEGLPKLLFTTGACTILNYSDTKAGKKGEFHHSIGAAVVEIKDNKVFFFRQISATPSGEFIDLFNHVKDKSVSRVNEVEACIMGDIHVDSCDPLVTDITLNDLFKKLKPKKVILHDICDSTSVSHHNLRDPFLLHELETQGLNSLSNELDRTIEWLKPFVKYDTYIIRSNHDEHIDRFLNETDWRRMTTFKNAIPYMELSLVKLKGGMKNGVIPYIINKSYPKIKCLGYKDDLIIKGWQCGMHGHIGASGSRGSLEQFSKLSSKSITAHSHKIGRIGGAVAVGTSTFLRVRYNNGPSSWINSHGIINKLGKFQHIVFIHTGKNKVEYTTLK